MAQNDPKVVSLRFQDDSGGIVTAAVMVEPSAAKEEPVSNATPEQSPGMLFSKPRDARSVAAAMFVGWLPIVLVNAYFVQRVPVQLGLQNRVLHHAYDAGQLVGLAALSWLLGYALVGRKGRVFTAVALLLAFAASYALLQGDLRSFLARHADSNVPWHPLLAACATLALAISLRLGWLFARGRLRFIAIASGTSIAVANHLVLELDYPAAHFLIACVAACAIGPALLDLLPLPPRAMQITAAVLTLLAVPAFVLVPGATVRTALLGSSGAVAAPYVSQLWSRLAARSAAPAQHIDSEWWKPRAGRPAVKPQPFPKGVKNPIVIFLTVDAMRADVVENRKYKKHFPNLIAMRKRALSFERVWSPAPSTRPTMAALFLGTYFSQQSWNRRAKSDGKKPPPRLPDLGQGPHLATLLTNAGVETVHLLTHDSLARGKGIGDGFAVETKLGGYAKSKKIIDALLARLDAHAKGPQFIFSHMLDPHHPYNRGKLKGSQKQRYIGEIAVVDAALGELHAGIKERKLDANTYVIVSADHGEGFYEHGLRFHARTVYEEMIRVPLYIEGPGVRGRRVRQAMTLMDITPTILDLFGVDTPGHFMGQSLVPFMAGKTPKLSRPVAVDSEMGMHAMLVGNRMKAMEHPTRGTEEVYDLKKDPKEQINLAETPQGQAHLAALREFFRVHAVKTPQLPAYDDGDLE